MRRTAILAILLSLSLCGCGTMGNMMGIHGQPKVYGGMRQDFRNVKSGYLAYVLDVPFSAVADTLTLPATLTKSR